MVELTIMRPDIQRMDTAGKEAYYNLVEERYRRLRAATFLWVAKYLKELETWNRDLWMHGLIVEVHWAM